MLLFGIEGHTFRNVLVIPSWFWKFTQNQIIYSLFSSVNVFLYVFNLQKHKYCLKKHRKSMQCSVGAQGKYFEGDNL
jgi:hypothetical protein